ncbi:MAG TPA: DUF983 domain-containing protein [Bacteroidia bacterium]|nr:DUF983 domain-containing protein [Bacteroidia bacterium]
MLQGTKLYSIIHNRCPRCHEGRFLVSNNPYNLKLAGKLANPCSVCGQNYELETGFYWGAMYVSYGINVLIFLIIWGTSVLVLPANTNPWWYIGTITITEIILVPFTFRLARLIWINFFVDYEK